MKKKVLMVYPQFPTTYWGMQYTLAFVGKKSLMPPLGLMTVAAMMPANYDIRLIDLNADEITKEDIQEADLVFLSAMIIQKASFDMVVRMSNECGKPVVAGGPYAISSWEHIEGVDHFVLGEAEETFEKFLKDHENGKAEKVYHGKLKPNLSMAPIPRFDLINVDEYSCLALQFSRGCPFKCEFCDIIEMFGNKPRTKPVENFLREIDAAFATGFRGPLFIVDDNFIGKKSKTKELLRGIIQWQKAHDFPFSFFTEASINLANDDELLDLMVEAGFNMVFIGVESPVEESLAEAQKKQNMNMDVQAGILKMQSRGIEVLAGFIVGFDTDPENIFDLQIDFIQKSGIPMCMVGMMLALPNTQLYRRLKKEDRLLGDTTGNNMQALKMNFVPKMPEEKIVAGYKKILSEIYNPKNYFDRCIDLIGRLPKQLMVSRAPRNKYMKILFLCLTKQTFSSYGLIYLRFLYRVFKVNPQNFPLAMNLAIKGYHFFCMTKEILAASKFENMMDKVMLGIDEQIEGLQKSSEPGRASVDQLKEYIIRLRNDVNNKHRRLNIQVRKAIIDSYAAFEKFCDGAMARCLAVTGDASCTEYRKRSA